MKESFMKYVRYMVRGFCVATGFLLDMVVPPDPEIRAIERMSADDFALNTGSAERLSLFPYKNPLVQKALVELKERPNQRIADMLGRALFERLAVELPPRAFPYLIVPIPITRRKRRERGWNQCELVLKGLQKADLRKAFDVRFDVLQKTRDTEDQVGKSRSERLQNVKGCFSVGIPAAVRDRQVVIFDDILTTGATLDEAERALTEAGARRVFRATIAR